MRKLDYYDVATLLIMEWMKDAWPVVAFLVGQTLTAVWWAAKITETVRSATESCSAAKDEAANLQRELSEYKLEAAGIYAKNTYLRDVEGRVIAQIEKVATELHELRKDITQAVASLASAKPGRR